MSTEREAPRPVPRRLRTVGLGFLILAVAIVVYGLVSRAAQGSKLKDVTEEQALPNVAVVSPQHVENQSGLELPGRLEAYIRAPIYARVAGYLKSWKHDIGSKVKAGDLLVVATLFVSCRIPFILDDLVDHC